MVDGISKAGPLILVFIITLATKPPLGYDGSQEPPYPFPHGHDYYYPDARDEFGYRDQ